MAKGPDLVKVNLAVEPSGAPVHDVDFKGEPEWFADNPHVKPSGLGEVPITYDPPVTGDSKLQFVRQVEPHQPDYVRCWAHQAPPRTLPNSAPSPPLLTPPYASYHPP